MISHLLCLLAGLVLPRLVPLILAQVQRTGSSEAYDEDDTLVLNLDSPTSRWHNMGWWVLGGTESFAEAAAEHCRRVAFAANLKPGQRVLEVGYGSGDSALLLAKEFTPSSYTGYTSIPAQQAVAAQRAFKADLSPTQYRLLCGDAAEDLGSLAPESIDSVLAVDCAFHFSRRIAFFRSAHTVLSPSSTLALSDLLLPSSPLTLLDRILLRLLCLAAGLPYANLLTASQYRASLVAAGFDTDDIEMQDISEHVWPGFLAWMDKREDELGRSRNVLGNAWNGLRGYAKVVRWYSGSNGGRSRLRFYLISARKSGGIVAEAR
ncbi:hypothetical protein JCM8547_001016 [Rhodosporidiobolus lusitaniae]